MDDLELLMLYFERKLMQFEQSIHFGTEVQRSSVKSDQDLVNGDSVREQSY
jgi:hypothetical protein